MLPVNKNMKISLSDISPFAFQVAGHAFGENAGKRSIGMYKHKDGYVLKPAIKSPHWEREMNFYQCVSSSYSQVQNFIPKYFGTGKINTNGYDGKFLILEDVIQGFEKPCIMDVKIGCQTWDPLATPKKIQSEKSKYAKCKRDLAFCIPGFQVYKPLSDNVSKFGKEYGKALDGTSAKKALHLFLNVEENKNAAGIVAKQFVNQLCEIEKWMLCQTSVHLFSSSILLTYDCAKFGSEVDTHSWIRVRMIDFAHAFPLSDDEKRKDENYLMGLQSLISVLQEVEAIS